MATELIINASLPETRIALMEEGEIQEVLIERAQGKGIVGNIYKGRVTRVLPGMQAAFVDIGLEKAAFLYVDDVFVHSHMFDDEEVSQEHHHDNGDSNDSNDEDETTTTGAELAAAENASTETATESAESTELSEETAPLTEEMEETLRNESEEASDSDEVDEEYMGTDPTDSKDNENPEGTLVAESVSSTETTIETTSENANETNNASTPQEEARSHKHRRGKRGGKKFNRPNKNSNQSTEANEAVETQSHQAYPESFQDHVAEEGTVESDRSQMTFEGDSIPADEQVASNRPEIEHSKPRLSQVSDSQTGRRPEFKEPRGRDRRIKSKQAPKPYKSQVNIQDLLQEGQEVLVQIAKDPISSKGARLTCHISLPGRHLVCMPTIDHVGVSRRIERDDERRKLRDLVEKTRTKGIGFIVRTASSAKGQLVQAEKRITQDVEYLTKLWEEIKDKAANVSAPALVYEDLNSILRAIRDWVNEDIDKVIVDSKFHYNEIMRFSGNFMPSLRQKVELYHGDVPIFDAYNISSELSRALERKVWLKSGGYIVIDQAEALVAIDVNTGRYVGKKSLEDTILKTNLEAVEEIAYQLRLRNCGGIIILDLIDMEKEENKYRVYRALEEALKKDRARPAILKISELGLVEMTRKRTRDTIVRTLCDPCQHCEAKGYVKSKHTVAYEILRDIEREGLDQEVNKILVKAHSDVVDLLAIDERDTLDQLEKRYRKTIYLQAVVDHHPEQFEVIVEKQGMKKASDEKILDRVRENQVRFGNADPRARRSRNHRDRNHRNEKGDRGGEKGDRDRTQDRPERNDRHDRPERNDRNEKRSESNGAPKLLAPAQPRSTPAPGTGSAVAAPAQTHQSRQPVEAYDPDSQANFITPEGMLKSEARRSQQKPAVIDPDSPEFMDEEDRLAYIRAQAAQDAAIARYGQSGDGLSSQDHLGNSRGRHQNNQQRWGRNQNNNQNGGNNGAGGRHQNNQKHRRGRFQRFKPKGFQNNSGNAPQNGAQNQTSQQAPVAAQEGGSSPQSNGSEGGQNSGE